MSLVNNILRRYADYQRLPVASSKRLSHNHWSCPKISILGLALNLGIFLAGGLMGVLAFPVFFSSSYSPTAAFRASQSSQTFPGMTPIPPSVFSPSIPTVMEPDKDYVAWNDHSNRNWRRLTERTEKVWIKDAASHGLGRGFESAAINGESHHDGPATAATRGLYRISNLHQLHCLSVLRTNHYVSLHNTTTDQAGAQPATQQAGAAERESIIADHIDHCIEYLRQSIMCGEGLTIEPNSPAGTDPALVADAWGKALGWGITRNCINWDNLVNWQRREYDEAHPLG